MAVDANDLHRRNGPAGELGKDCQLYMRAGSIAERKDLALLLRDAKSADQEAVAS